MSPGWARINLLLAIAALSPALRGGAWTQEEGHGQMILNFSFLESSHWFDSSGKLQTFSGRGTFHETLVNPYFEFGLTPNNTLVLNASAPWMRFSNAYGSSSSAGLGDTEIDFRRRLSGKSKTVVAVQMGAQFPLYSASRTPPPGNHQLDIEPRLLIGRGGTLAGRHAFASVGVAYRYRQGAPADQFRSDLTLGIDATHRFMAMVQFFGITGIQNGTPFATGGNPNVESDFDLYKMQYSLVIRVDSRTRVQTAWVDSFRGRNTGAGHTLLVALWRDF